MMSVSNLHTVFSTVYPEEGRLLEFVLTLQMFNERAATAAGCPVLMTRQGTRVCACAPVYSRNCQHGERYASNGYWDKTLSIFIHFFLFF